MPPFSSSYDDPPMGFTNGMTRLIMQITMIGIVAGSFFQSGESIFATAIKLLFVGILYDVAQQTIDLVTRTLQARLRTHKTFEEGTVEYRWIMSFLIQKNMWPDTCKGGYEFPVSDKHVASLWWNRTWVKVARFDPKDRYYSYDQQTELPKAYIEVTLYGIRSSAMSKLLQKAEQQYNGIRHHTVTVYSPSVVQNSSSIPSTHSQQNWLGKKQVGARLLDSTSLSVQDLASLVEEARAFFDSGLWHNETSIPWQKRYLLHGPSGSGKRDAVYAVAGKLGRAVYSLSLANPVNVDNSFLLSAIATVPKGSIFLLENIDFIFEWPYSSPPSSGFQPYAAIVPATIYGLLQMLDTTARQEGILLFATATKTDKLDDALFMPGRIDKKIEFRYITKEQAGRLFVRFYAAGGFKEYEPSAADKKSLKLDELANEFGTCITENEFTVSQVRFYLLKHQQSPESAVANAQGWVKLCLEQKAKQIEQEIEAEEMRFSAKKAKEEQDAKLMQPSYDCSGYPRSPWTPFAAPIVPTYTSSVSSSAPYTPTMPEPAKLEEEEDDDIPDLVEDGVKPSE
ncbi:P-loop containing nucleoside triphosphate hydrolase protein [Pholiota conissans]|uniref:P-loop containing nucleoside triphosphate hydrolase protein n=1 Tax=Pholiota conissans TaxID=109636 RepID=A0A9P5Z717_9AGAR|nr:P-loop containing nucleoside triphosphate hydrolase protein [Pholiota conissans]